MWAIFLILFTEFYHCSCHDVARERHFSSKEGRFTVHFSSPEPLGSKGELIVYPSSRRPSVGVVRLPFLMIFSETAWPIKAKFYVGLPWRGGTKVCINGPGHMTKMAAMPIYGKNL